MEEKRVNPDLQEEREKCSFDRQEFIKTVGDDIILKQIAEFEKDVETYPELKSDHTIYEMSREE